jgi:hypothetical protein
MELKGKQLDLLERADEYAQIMGKPKHAAARFTQLSPGDRGMALALQEYVDARIDDVLAKLSAHLTRGDCE